MLLSPDECKWSERLTPTREGMRCGFTGTRVWECVCVMREMCSSGSTVWNSEWKDCECMCPSSVTPTSPWTLTSSSSSCWASHRKTHWPLQRANDYVCICMSWAKTRSQAWIARCPVHVTSLSAQLCTQKGLLLALHHWAYTRTCFQKLASWTPTYM